MLPADEQEIRATLYRAAGDSSPPGRVWLGIEKQINRPQARRFPLWAAAAGAAMAVSLLVALQVYPGPWLDVPPPEPAPAAQARAGSGESVPAAGPAPTNAAPPAKPPGMRRPSLAQQRILNYENRSAWKWNTKYHLAGGAAPGAYPL